MAASDSGRRLLASTIDQISLQDPNRSCYSIPQDPIDLSKGFIDITFAQFANAINHAAAWLTTEVIPVANVEFDTFAYEGPADLRLAVIAVAAVKVRRKILLPFPLVPAPVKGHMLDTTDCKAFVYAETSQKNIQGILQERPHVLGIMAPPLHTWLTEQKAEQYEYAKSWNEAADDPWLIFHTSGTTGFPRTIVYTNRMMTTYDVASLLPDADQDTQASCHVKRRVYSSIPMNHVVGMTVALQGTVWLESTIVLGPPNPTDAKLADQILQYSNIDGIVAPPSLIRGLCQSPTMQQHLQTLKFIQWAGGPLDEKSGDALKESTKLSPAFGSTEAGPYLTLLTEDPEDWAYYRFRPGQGIEFSPFGSQLFELVFRKQEDAYWQQIFLLYPELDEFHTKDLFERHPTKEGLWLYSGRTDDIVILANRMKLHAAQMEEVMLRNPDIQAVVVGGDGKDEPFLLIQPSDAILSSSIGRDEILARVWPAVELANAASFGYVDIRKDLTIVVNGAKPIVRSGKGSVMRRETIALYKSEIDELYAKN